MSEQIRPRRLKVFVSANDALADAQADNDRLRAALEDAVKALETALPVIEADAQRLAASIKPGEEAEGHFDGAMSGVLEVSNAITRARQELAK